MTHDELLKAIDAGVTNLPQDFQRYRGVIRTVVELHKPETESPKCNVCKEGYPCSTIESIEKELL